MPFSGKFEKLNIVSIYSTKLNLNLDKKVKQKTRHDYKGISKKIKIFKIQDNKPKKTPVDDMTLINISILLFFGDFEM